MLEEQQLLLQRLLVQVLSGPCWDVLTSVTALQQDGQPDVMAVAHQALTGAEHRDALLHASRPSHHTTKASAVVSRSGSNCQDSCPVSYLPQGAL